MAEDLDDAILIIGEVVDRLTNCRVDALDGLRETGCASAPGGVVVNCGSDGLDFLENAVDMRAVERGSVMLMHSDRLAEQPKKSLARSNELRLKFAILEIELTVPRCRKILGRGLDVRIERS